MERVFLTMFGMSITASLLAVTVLVLRLLFKKAPKALFCILWGFVAIRLIFPISLESPFSLVPATLTASYSVLDRTDFEKVHALPEQNTVSEPSQGTVTVLESEPLPENVLSTLSEEITEISGTSSEALLTTPTDTWSDSAVAELQTSVHTLIVPVPVADTVAEKDNASFLKGISLFASVLWPLGILGMLLYGSISYLRVRRKTKEAVYLRNNIWLCDHVASPFILGTLRPRIILPSTIQPEEAPPYRMNRAFLPY